MHLARDRSITATGMRYPVPAVNPFKPPMVKRASTSNLSGMAMDSANLGITARSALTEGGDSYVIVDKDFVEVNAFADGMRSKRNCVLLA